MRQQRAWHYSFWEARQAGWRAADRLAIIFMNVRLPRGILRVYFKAIKSNCSGSWSSPGEASALSYLSASSYLLRFLPGEQQGVGEWRVARGELGEHPGRHMKSLAVKWPLRKRTSFILCQDIVALCLWIRMEVGTVQERVGGTRWVESVEQSLVCAAQITSGP